MKYMVVRAVIFGCDGGNGGGWLQPCYGGSNGVVQDCGHGGQRIGISDGWAEADILRRRRPGYSQKNIMGLHFVLV